MERVPGVPLTNALNDMDLEIKSTSAGVTKSHHFRRLDHHSLYPPSPRGAQIPGREHESASHDQRRTPFKRDLGRGAPVRGNPSGG